MEHVAKSYQLEVCMTVPASNSNSDDLSMNTRRVLWFCGVILVMKFLSIWYHYVPPFNILSKIGMLAILMWLSVLFLRNFRQKKWLPFFFGTIVSASLMFLPITNDSRAVGLRYRAEYEMNNLSSLQQNKNEHVLLSSGMGESVYLKKGVIPNARMFIPQGQHDSGCYGELTQITNDVYIDYDVCPSGTGVLVVSVFFLNFLL